MVQVFGNHEIIAPLILLYLDDMSVIVKFFSIMKSLRDDVGAFKERVLPLVTLKLLQPYCDGDDYILAINLRRVYSYAEFIHLQQDKGLFPK